MTQEELNVVLEKHKKWLDGEEGGEMWEIVPVLEDGSGPKEYFKNYAEVWARERTEAKVKAVRSKAFKQWRDWCRDEESSPYEGLSVRLLLTNSHIPATPERK